MSVRRVCDACHSRKVRCDRNDPCGNCLDQSSVCTRSRGMRRLPKRDLQSQRQRQRQRQGYGNALALAPRSSSTPTIEPSLQLQPGSEFDIGLEQPEVEEGRFLLDMFDEQQLMLLNQFDLDVNMNMSTGYSWMEIVPLTEDQMIRRRVNTAQDMTWSIERRQALESALSVAGRVLGSMEQSQGAEMERGVEERHIPSFELLYWMLNDIGSPKFGSFISDYFRHVGKDSLKHMGLALISNTATPPDSTLYTVCVNSLAFKFLNATLGTVQDNEDELTQNLRHNALLYRETAKAALKEIPLITKPSLSLLQALLCGIFLHQGSGDTNTCRELTKTACRVCMDIGLYPGATDLQSVTEAEYYCFMWCYKLDRNYAWKFGSARILTLDTDPEIVLSPSTALNVSASEMVLINLDLAKVQDAMIPFLNDPARAAREDIFNLEYGIGTGLLRRMEGIRRDIDQIREPSPKWTGLDSASEIATLDFAYHCILTNLLHLRQLALSNTAHLTPVETYLDSARRGLHALISLCASDDRRQTVAYLHWTLLYYPITAYIALFYNAVATSHSGDFAILTTVARCLAKTGSLSPRVAAMQGLFQEFVVICRGVFFDGGDVGLDLGGDMGLVSVPFEGGRGVNDWGVLT
ncbi:hypothetical protein ASPVEDRAFT_73383 [Aspergillus versicolor CBS 583.65]|uniref:Zn(2)-C6 fungal-type domain-containing protein n=1 Tax=Aspergillus versicolor CBS 583.65 TaxID=1036611 RepID=A0A1L9PQD9_ASPVE|nr:uncharacterized protein ASPVEDRAFT_73383 [Aspergillus versicolor CBS 583.65]OJJ03747.1 hypothetical protein ASPVEDRAFT_73383 [Aspergillus versicolor CBS 583.65]